MGGSLELKTKEGFWKRSFGDKEFITYYWRLYTPALFYGIFFAFAPIIVSNLFALADTNVMVGITNGHNSMTQGQFINLVYTQGNSLWNSMYFFVVVVIRTGVGPIGNAIGRNNKKEIQSIIRLCFWLIFLISLIIMLAICLDATQVLKSLQLVGSQIDQTDDFRNAVNQYVNWSAISVFFYGLGMLYQPMFSTYKKTFPQMFAALFSFVFFLIAAPCYVLGSASAGQSVDQVISRCNVSAVLVDAYYFAMIFFFAIYCAFPKMLTVRTTNPTILKNKWYIEHQQRLTAEASTAMTELWRMGTLVFYKTENVARTFNFFRTGIWFTKFDVKTLCYVGWSIFLDQVIWSIANVFLIIYSTNVNNAAWQIYNTAAKPASLLNNYVYSVANSFAILPSAFVAYELGLNNVKKAKENGWKLYYWGTGTAAILMIIIFIIASFMPGLTVRKDAVQMSIGLTMIFGVSVLFNSAYQIALNVLFSGGNRWVQLNNALVTIINSFAVIVVINDQIVHHGMWAQPTEAQFYGYYVIGKCYVIVKFTIATILLSFTNWAHNSNEIDKGKKAESEKLNTSTVAK